MPLAEAAFGLVRKLEIKTDSPCCAWLERAVAQRFDLACRADQEAFRREQTAVTRTGQIKMPGERDEKDDRRRYELGWSNAAKIAALEESARRREAQLGAWGSRISALQQEQKKLKERLEALFKIDEYNDFRELDWGPTAVAIARLEAEKRELEAASDRLQTLAAQLRELEIEQASTERQMDERKDRVRLEQEKIGFNYVVEALSPISSGLGMRCSGGYKRSIDGSKDIGMIWFNRRSTQKRRVIWKH
ncbi:hypothetical protein [Desulfococcus sp.]|uniref:hypothetical protein n=1 Tax=Desulfococcus sp. TaxID=2025834 RepID=UPI003593C8C5